MKIFFQKHPFVLLFTVFVVVLLVFECFGYSLFRSRSAISLDQMQIGERANYAADQAENVSQRFIDKISEISNGQGKSINDIPQKPKLVIQDIGEIDFSDLDKIVLLNIGDRNRTFSIYKKCADNNRVIRFNLAMHMSPPQQTCDRYLDLLSYEQDQENRHWLCDGFDEYIKMSVPPSFYGKFDEGTLLSMWSTAKYPWISPTLRMRLVGICLKNKPALMQAEDCKFFVRSLGEFKDADQMRVMYDILLEHNASLTVRSIDAYSNELKLDGSIKSRTIINKLERLLGKSDIYDKSVNTP